MIAKSHHCQLTALALAALLSVWVTPATALSLGRITVQSALGEPLKAEIDVLDINADEAASLVTKVASPDAFVNAGLDYNPALSNLRVSLLRRGNGRAFLRLTSDRAVAEPFVDMILEANWNSGRIVRDYTMLFDPPSLRTQAPGAPTSTQLPAPAPEAASRPARTAPIQVAPAPSSPITQREPAPAKAVAPAARPAAPVAVAKPTKPAPVAPATAKPADQGQSVTVKPGDTAGAIAMAHKSTNVSLDQMLVALLRANPDAFIEDNVNRIKAGAIVSIPSEEQANATDAGQATQLITAQSQDFNAYRRKFAGNVPTANVAPATRDVTGKVQAAVEDKKPAAANTDKLTLTKGTVQGKSSEEELAKTRNAEEAASRSAELSKNIKELDQLAAAASAPAATASVAAAPAAAAEPASAALEAAPASAPQAAAPAPKKPAPAPEPVAEPSFIDDLMADPMVPAGAAALVALLVGLGLYKVRQRKKSEQMDSSFVNSDLAFADGSGGQHVDTGDSLTTGSSMVYSPSQLDAVDDVDPVAEADVYLAYGRDSQAEEILKDALRTNPQRVAIHQKLLEIYAKRNDPHAFESIAALAFNLTDGSGPEWEQICEKGLAIDPDNALYLPGGQPLPSQLPEFDKTTPGFMPSSTAKLTTEAEEDDEPDYGPIATGPGDLDLDLDFIMDDAVKAAEAAPTPAPDLSSTSETDADELAAMNSVAATEVAALPTITADLMPESTDDDAASGPPTVRGAFEDNLDFSTPTVLDFDTPTTELASSEAADQPSTAPAAAADNELMSFDLGSLSLDLGEDGTTVPGAFDEETMDPLETKLALADEFRAIGDEDGARALIEEVIAEASGDLRSKAQNALGKL